MPAFSPTDLAIELLTLWLVLSGVGWAGWATYRTWARGVDTAGFLLLGAALAGWLAVIWLTTPILGGVELVPLGLKQLLWSALPVSAVVSAVAVAVALLSRSVVRSPRALAVALLSSVLLPATILPVLVGGASEVSLMSNPLPATVSDAPPADPLTDEAHPGMVFVPAGPFIMGTLNAAQLRQIVGNVGGDEQPVRSVYLDAYFIDRYEVTNRQFARFVESTGHVTQAEELGGGQVWGREGWFLQARASWRQPMGPGDSIDGLDDHPVVQVSWNDAKAYCAWESKRLPSEAEWEKSARGIDARDYPWGRDFDPARLNFCDAECVQLPTFNDRSVSDGYARTAPVGSFPGGVSPYGTLDMVGNVWEWVEDWYDADYYSYGPTTNPRGPDRSAGIGADYHKVVRGGSWTSERDFARATSRSYDPPDNSYFGVGFRCASDG